MSAPSGHYANLADLVASEQGVDTSPEFELADPTQLVTWRSQELQPPTAQYITVDDVLRMVITNVVANLQVGFTARLLRPDGTISYVQNVFVPPADGFPHSFDTQLAEGFLLSVNVSVFSGLTLRGNAFLQVRLVRATQGNIFAWATLISDYLSLNGTLGWPGGSLRNSLEGAGALQVVRIADPAAGAEWTFTVPTNTRIRLRYGKAILNTSAAVGNRQVNLNILSAANGPYRVAAAAALAPSNASYYVFGCGLPLATSGAIVALLPLPQEVMLSAGDLIGSNTTGLDAADQWTTITFAYEQWLIA